MSLGPTATSIMQPYGLPCALSTEAEVRAKTARKAAPVAVEVNNEGVIQLDGLSTRGMVMFGGPGSYERNVTVLATDSAGTTLTAAQLVDGFLVLPNSGNATINLPTVNALNAFFNTNLVSNAAAIAVGDGLAVQSAPRTCFKVSIATNANVVLHTQNTATVGHGGNSGFQRLAFPANGAGDAVLTTGIPINTDVFSLLAATLTTTPRSVIDVWFIQTTGPTSDPEWLVLSN